MAPDVDRAEALTSRLRGRAADRRAALALARACWPNASASEERLLGLHLSAIMALDDEMESEPPHPTVEAELASLLPWHAPLDGADARQPIRAVLQYVEEGLVGVPLAEPRAGSAHAWWRMQAERTVSASWQESRWRLDGSRPDEATYLAVARQSIAVGWIVASLRLLDGATTAPPAGGRTARAVVAVARAIRLANDLHDPAREQREGKVQLLFLRARAWEARGRAPVAAEATARRELDARLERGMARARALLEEPGWSDSPRLRAALSGVFAAALGLYLTPRAADAVPRAPARRRLAAGGRA